MPVTRATHEEIVLADKVGPGDAGTYRYLPFTVPPGVCRLDAVLDADGAALGFGVFDQRGPHYQSPGFRGIHGAEDNAFFLTATAASPGFLPGPLGAGRWTIIVPVFAAPEAQPVTVRLRLACGPVKGQPPASRGLGVVNPSPGWYWGDLHCHTTHSSDARASGSALAPAGWAEACRGLGLDFAALTDHNVVSQNLALAEDAGHGVLLLPGEEMTNWFHGHATVAGVAPGAWLDWRQRPLGRATDPYERRITDFVRTAREMGAFTSAAHPFVPLPGLPWTFFTDADTDPGALPDAIEVWTGPFASQEAIDAWDALLRRGLRVVANGGSDLHAVDSPPAASPGAPATVVWAERLEQRALIAALRAGRCFVTRNPRGPELYLTASGPGGQATFTGGTIYGPPSAVVEIEVLVRRGAAGAGEDLRLVLLRDGVPFSSTAISRDEQRVAVRVPLAASGFVRAELRSAADPRCPGAPLEALTNPIFLSTDPRPDDAAPEHAPPPPHGGVSTA